MWGPLVASGTLINGVIMPSNPYSQFIQPNMKWVHSVPKIKSATKQWMGWLRPQNPGWIQPNPLIPQPNTREEAPRVPGPFLAPIGPLLGHGGKVMDSR